MISHLAGNK